MQCALGAIHLRRFTILTNARDSPDEFWCTTATNVRMNMVNKERSWPTVEQPHADIDIPTIVPATTQQNELHDLSWNQQERHNLWTQHSWLLALTPNIL
jgi:hypothetical protein